MSSIQPSINSVVTSVIDTIYPIGSIYESTLSTNPATLLGVGTWAAFGAGRVLVGIDTGQTEFDTVEETGGAKTHTLTSSEMPAHTHTIRGSARIDSVGVKYGANGSSDSANMTPLSDGANSATYTGILYAASSGGGGSHNNLQPYVVVYRWKRTA